MQIRSQHSVLDHHCPLSRHALIVEIQGAAVASDGRVIHDIDSFRTNPLPHLVREDGLALSVEISLESVSHGLVKQNARSTSTHHHLHLPALRPACLEGTVNAVRQTGRKSFHHFICKHLRALAKTYRVIFLDTPLSVISHNHSGNGGQRTGLVFEFAERIVHHIIACLTAQKAHYAHDSAVLRLDGLFQTVEISHDHGRTLFPPVFQYRITVRRRVRMSRIKSPDETAAIVLLGSVRGPHASGFTRRDSRALRNSRGRKRSRFHIFPFRTFRVGITGLLTAQHPDSHTVIDIQTARRDLPVHELIDLVRGVLEIQVAIVPAVRECRRHKRFQVNVIDLECVIIIFLICYHCRNSFGPLRPSFLLYRRFLRLLY